MLMHDSLIPAPCRAASGRVARWLRLIVLAVAGMFVLAGCGQEKPGAVELVLPGRSTLLNHFSGADHSPSELISAQRDIGG